MRTTRSNVLTGTSSKNSTTKENTDHELDDLILWNISKAFEKNPDLNLMNSLLVAQRHLEEESRDGNGTIDKGPEEQQHCVYALLAWQQLGHNDIDSLYQFIKSNSLDHQSSCNIEPKLKVNSLTVSSDITYSSSRLMDEVLSRTYAKGPVVKLPIDTKVVMRLDHCPRSTGPSNKVKATCCMDSACAESLAAMDKATEELRERATKLAKREAERVELLERAEAAWGDLELGYQRRLTLAKEKKEDLNKKIEKTLAERNTLKEQCCIMSQDLRAKGELAEKERNILKDLQKEVCRRACERLKLSEEATRGDALLVEEHCKAVQLERDLQFKEEQAKRKLLLMESETESASALMHDAERAMRAELSALRDQITQVSAQLLGEDELTGKIKEELDALRQEKDELVMDLDSCKDLCDKKMGKLIEQAQKKREELEVLKEKVIECKCKNPVEVGVEVKRTPSLAALCKCAPEDRLTETCSCSSLRSSLISSLLADLFGGLQSELSGAGLQMPCQLMKCLEDKHNWDRASVVKTNLRSFFTKLLVGELDIAIASAIENYHAKWIGASCADAPKLTPRPGDDMNEGWEARALERRAQQLAAKLAEQLFQERAEELTKRAKEIVTAGPPPCECGKKVKQNIMPCLVSPLTPFKRPPAAPLDLKPDSYDTPGNWKRTNQDVTELKSQVKALKKEFIKKEDLKIMEENIAKIIKENAVPEKDDIVTLESRYIPKDYPNMPPKAKKKDIRNVRNANLNEASKLSPLNKYGRIKKKLDPSNATNSKKNPTYEKPSKQSKKTSYSQDYAVNLCLCGEQITNKVLPSAQLNTDDKTYLKQKPSKGLSQQNSDNINGNDCPKDCKCILKKPSNKSIDKLLVKLAKWKSDLENPKRLFLNNSQCNLNSKCFLNKISKSEINTSLQNNSNTPIFTIKDPKNSENGNRSEILEKTGGKVKGAKSVTICLAANTPSEYMADINLDKSNEFTSKNIDITEEPMELKKQPEHKNSILNQCLINSVEVEPTLKEKHKPGSKELIKKYNNKKYHSTDLKLLTNSKSTKMMTPKKYDDKIRTQENDILNSNKTETLPNDFDYYIKFLGVTLDDVDCDKEGNEDDVITPPTPQKCNEKQELHNIGSPNLTEAQNKQQIIDANNINMLSNAQSGESNAKYEEFQRFIMKIFKDQFNKTNHKDIALDSQSFGNSLNDCVCCPSLIDGAKELEVNTFDLLENHLKEKLDEFKKRTCKSSCIPTKEADKIFSTILKKVKQVISDCANEAKGNESEALTSDGSWKRVYGLLQEYLKAKLKHVECLPFFTEHRDVILPNTLEKVSHLIEDDFQRLKDICKCKKSDKMLTNNAQLKKKLQINEELPEKDTNVTKSIFKPVSIQNSNTPAALVQSISSQVTPKIKACDASAEANSKISVISRENSIVNSSNIHNMSSQVPPHLGMISKSCDIMEIGDINTEISKNKFPKLPEFIYNDCNCNVSKKKSNSSIYKLLRNKDVLINLYADVLINSNFAKAVNKPHQNVVDRKCHENLVISKSLPDFGIIEDIKKYVDLNKQEANHKEPANIPLVGCTINCTCEANLKECVCTKSAVRDYNHISNHWKQLIENNKKCIKDLSYIMYGSRKNNNLNSNIFINESSSIYMPKFINQHFVNNTCATNTMVDSGDNLALIISDSKYDTRQHQTTNTYDETINFQTDMKNTFSQHLYECKAYKSILKPIVKVSNFDSPYNSNDSSIKYVKSDATIHIHNNNCNCIKVPVCHVKMLVNNIEQSIINSQCTCDIMSSVCPLHF